MKHFAIFVAAIILYKLITTLLSISYNLFTEPFDLFKLLLDLAVFAVVYVVVRFLVFGAGTFKS